MIIIHRPEFVNKLEVVQPSHGLIYHPGLVLITLTPLRNLGHKRNEPRTVVPIIGCPHLIIAPILTTRIDEGDFLAAVVGVT